MNHEQTERLTQEKPVNHMSSQIYAIQNTLQKVLEITYDVSINKQKSELQTQFERCEIYWIPIFNDVQEALLPITYQVNIADKKLEIITLLA